MKERKGLGVSKGFAKAKALLFKEPQLAVEKKKITDSSLELARLQQALLNARRQLTALIESAKETLGNETEIFEAQLLMLQDPDYINGIQKIITQKHLCAEYACQTVCTDFQELFLAMDDPYMQERATDVQDITTRILKILMGISENPLDAITEECILLAKDFTPSTLAHVDTRFVKGFLTEQGGYTSHSAILARSMGIPAVTGIPNLLSEIQDKELLLLDGLTGQIFSSPDENTLRSFSQKQSAYEKKQMHLTRYLTKSGQTADGHPIPIYGNIEFPADAIKVKENGGEGIGLFRSEFLFLKRPSLPTEEEQFQAYREALCTMAPYPVTIRTLDAGGDKNIPALSLSAEINPFLGYRAIRICLAEEELFLTQLRALLRASVFGSLKIMFPMISSLEELRRSKQLLEKAKTQLTKEQIPFADKIPVGMMVEIPTAALCAPLLAQEVDFFSIGTNDLIQYSCAVDRLNTQIAHLYQPLHPGVLRLLQMTADAAKANGIECSVCGEMAGTSGMATFLCGLGITGLSMSASLLSEAKAELAQISYETCIALAKKLCSGISATENNVVLQQYLASFSERGIHIETP